MLYYIAGGTTVSVWAARLFIPFFQAADESVLHPQGSYALLKTLRADSDVPHIYSKAPTPRP
jgi:hypothetical protein